MKAGISDIAKITALLLIAVFWCWVLITPHLVFGMVSTIVPTSGGAYLLSLDNGFSQNMVLVKSHISAVSYYLFYGQDTIPTASGEVLIGDFFVQTRFFYYIMMQDWRHLLDGWPWLGLWMGMSLLLFGNTLLNRAHAISIGLLVGVTAWVTFAVMAAMTWVKFDSAINQYAVLIFGFLLGVFSFKHQVLIAITNRLLGILLIAVSHNIWSVYFFGDTPELVTLALATGIVLWLPGFSMSLIGALLVSIELNASLTGSWMILAGSMLINLLLIDQERTKTALVNAMQAFNRPSFRKGKLTVYDLFREKHHE